MHYIDPTQKHIVKARKIHFDEMLPILIEKIDNCTIPSLKLFLKKHIHSLLKSKPNKLEKIQNELFTTFPDFEVFLKEKNKTVHYDHSIRSNFDPFFHELKRIINYDEFTEKKDIPTDYDAYSLAKNLKINTCTYCNRLYTKTVISTNIKNKIEKLTRPTFDHWFPKSKFPLLALSFYNLIPSCTVCNSSVKSSDNMNLPDYLHPYIDKKINFQFSYKLNSLNKYEFTIKNIGDDPNSKSKRTADFFKLKEIYETHEDEIADLIKIKKAYSVTYIKTMKALFKNAGSFSNEEIYRLAFGTEINETKFERRPLSRMKRDILSELGIIKK